MDKQYADTVRLLLNITPDVFANDIFAMKGGTAINLFVQDMPRLSVDIDVVYLPWQVPRDEALMAINEELAAIAQRVEPLGIQARLIRSKELGDTKLIAEDETSQVKVEVNVVFRGTVLPVAQRPLGTKTSDRFGVEFSVPTLDVAELYAGKLVAALDRQHPRDLFDVWRLFETGGITDEMVECFVVYLAGHNRPIHEVLFGNDKDIANEFERAFVGMTELDCPLGQLIRTRARLRHELPKRLSSKHESFLRGLARAQPDWALLQCQHAEQLPALRWKLSNLLKFMDSRPGDLLLQADMLDAAFKSVRK
ncbi:nucleotidyl transferase AbiEii/AbiGii toxin family protein [Pseudomonas aeruginosa]